MLAKEITLFYTKENDISLYTEGTLVLPDYLEMSPVDYAIKIEKKTYLDKLFQYYDNLAEVILKSIHQSKPDLPTAFPDSYCLFLL